MKDRLTDHQRGCAGRDYTCTCGYDDAVNNRLEAFKQEVSDAFRSIYLEEAYIPERIHRFIIPKPDPLVEVMKEFGWGISNAEDFRAALDALGFEIRSKNDG